MNHQETVKLSIKDCIQVLRETGSLLKEFPATTSQSPDEVATLHTDSRKVSRGDIFLAYRGVSHDSHRYINKLASGFVPALFILENPEFVPDAGSSHILLVKDSREAWSWLCAKAMGHPEKHMSFIGVTGTNGKTSICWIIKNLLELAGTHCLSIGTLGFSGHGHLSEGTHTTPDPPEFFKALKKAKESGVKWVVMECSSHGLVQNKFAPIRFAACGWSGFTRDHLDFHETMEQYWQAKWLLFSRHLAEGGRAVISSTVSPLPENSSLPGHELIFTREEAPGTLEEVSTVPTPEGTQFSLTWKNKRYQGNTGLTGEHNAENFLLALILAEQALKKMPAANTWKSIPQIPGRLERVSPTGKNLPTVYVDYAHTPDALKNVLKTLKALRADNIISVFGCGGDRDQGKRPEMAQAVAQYSDHIVVTSDNPRSENPATIIAHITKGFSEGDAFDIHEDREKAIRSAIFRAGENDIVLIAGKGHEAYQIQGNQTLQFDDRLVASRYLQEKKESL